MAPIGFYVLVGRRSFVCLGDASEILGLAELWRWPLTCSLYGAVVHDCGHETSDAFESTPGCGGFGVPASQRLAPGLLPQGYARRSSMAQFLQEPAT